MATVSTVRKQLADADKIESQRQETIQRYRMVFEATNDVLYDIDLQTGTVIWNDALHTQYGYDKVERADRLEWWTEHVHPDDALALENELNEWFSSEHDTWEFEHRFLKADGIYIDVRDRCVLLRTPEGAPKRIIGSFLDITQQKQLSNAKDEFISLVSHQLRTPLTAVRIYSEMLSSGLLGQLTADQKMPVRHITDSSVRLIKLVDDILNISRVELGHVVSSPTPTNINEAINTHIEDVLPLASEKGVTIIFKPDLNIEDVPVDATICGQVIHNLLTNAIKYTKLRKGVVEVTFERNKNGYLLSVADNGIGIPESAEPNIFQRFYRADNARGVDGHGSGLGLYLVKLMTETAGCDIWFESKEGKGTTFYVQLPKGGMIAG